MDVRQRTEEIEHLTFAPWATFSDASRGMSFVNRRLSGMELHVLK